MPITLAFGPGRSCIIAGYLFSFVDALRIFIRSFRCSSKVLCEKLSLKTSTPLFINDSNILIDDVAGPMVAMIFACLIVAPDNLQI